MAKRVSGYEMRGFGGLVPLRVYMNREDGSYELENEEHARVFEEGIAAEDAELSKYGMGLNARPAKDEKEAARWEREQRLRGQELSQRNQALMREAKQRVPATLVDVTGADGKTERKAVPTEELSGFLKRVKAEGGSAELLMTYRARGIIDEEDKRVDVPGMDLVLKQSDPNVRSLLSYLHENKLGGYIEPGMAQYLGIDQAKLEHGVKVAQAQGERYDEALKRKGAMGVAEAEGSRRMFGRMTLSEANQGEGAFGQTLNYFNAALNPVGGVVNERAEAVIDRLASDSGLEELRQREAAGEPLLGRFEKGMLGFGFSGALPEGLNNADELWAYLRSLRADRLRGEQEEGLRGTTFGADVVRGTADSARMGAEFGLMNAVMPGFGGAVAAGGLKKAGAYAVGAAGQALLHGGAKADALMADRVQYNAGTGELEWVGEGASRAEAMAKGYSAAALEYLGEMATMDVLKFGYRKIMPSKAQQAVSRFVGKAKGSKAAQYLDRVAANPTIEQLRKLQRYTGFNASLSGMLEESIGEEMPANMISAAFNLERTSGELADERAAINAERRARGEGELSNAAFTALDIWGAAVDTLKAAPAMAVSVALMGAGQGVAVRSAQGVYTYGTSKKRMREALSALGVKEQELQGMSKAQMNDRFFAEMRERGKVGVYDPDEIGAMGRGELVTRAQEVGLMQSAQEADGMTEEELRKRLLEHYKQLGDNVITQKALDAVLKGVSIQGGRALRAHGNIVDRLEADVFSGEGAARFSADEREGMREVMLLRSMAGGSLYQGTLYGQLLEAMADAEAAKLGEGAKVALARFEGKFGKVGDVPFKRDGVRQWEESSFRQPMASDFKDGEYVDGNSGIRLSSITDADGKTRVRVDADGTVFRPNGMVDALDAELDGYGLTYRNVLPYGVENEFGTLAEARAFAREVSAWNNTRKRALADKARVAQRMYERIRGEGSARDGLVLLDSIYAAPSAIQDEVMEALKAAHPLEDERMAMARAVSVNGFTSAQDGKVYVFIDQVKSPYEMLATIQHEGLHQGLMDGFLGDKKRIEAFLGELTRDKALPKWFADGAKRARNARDVEELLAEAAETLNAGPGIFSRVSRALKRASGLEGGFKLEMSDADVEKVIFSAWKSRRLTDGTLGVLPERGSGLFETVRTVAEGLKNEAAQTGAETGAEAEAQAPGANNEQVSEGSNGADGAGIGAQAAGTQQVKPAAQAEAQVRGNAAQANGPTEENGTRERQRAVVRGNEDLLTDEDEEADEAPTQEVKPENANQGKRALGGLAVVDMINDRASEAEDVSVSQIAVNDRIKQFKRGADPKRGVIPGEELQGEWAGTVARPIRVMSFNDGHLEVITGRHLLDLAKRNGMEKIPAYVYREADGMTIEKARELDALENILDDKGGVKDYVRFFSNDQISDKDLERLGISTSERTSVRDAYAIARRGIEEVRVHALADDGKVSLRVLGAIARHDKRVQRALLDEALKRGVSDWTAIDAIGNAMEGMRGREAVGGEQGDLFGDDDAALEEARAVGLGVAEMVREAKKDRDIVSAVLHREKNVQLKPEAAKRLGIKDKNDVTQLQRAYDAMARRIAELESPTLGGALRAEALRRGQAQLAREAAKGKQQEFNFNGKRKEQKPVKQQEAVEKPVKVNDTVSQGVAETSQEALESRQGQAKPNDTKSVSQRQQGASVSSELGDGFERIAQEFGLLREPRVALGELNRRFEQPGMLREGLKDVDRVKRQKIIDAVRDFVEDYIDGHREDKSLRMFDSFCKRLYDDLNAKNPRLWDIFKPFIRSSWVSLVDLREDFGLDDVSNQGAREIFSRIEREGVMIEGRKEQNDDTGAGLQSGSGQGRGPVYQGEVSAGQRPAGGGVYGDGQRGDGQRDADAAALGDDVSAGLAGDQPVAGHEMGNGESDQGGGGAVQRPVAGADYDGDKSVSAGDSGIRGDGGVRGGGDAARPVDGGQRRGGRAGEAGGAPDVAQAAPVVVEQKPEKKPAKAEPKPTKELAAKPDSKAGQKQDEKPRPTSRSANYVIPEDGSDGGITSLRGKKAHYAANVAAIRVLKKLDEEGAIYHATPEEQAVLSRYAGWGGLAEAFDSTKEEWAEEFAELKELLTPEEYAAARRGTQYAHYTPIPVVRGIYDALVRGVGLQGSGLKAYEAGVGVGHFIGAMPEGLRGTAYTGVDVDPMTTKIAQALYPHASISNVGFQSVKLEDGTLDFVVGNPPFSDTKLTDVDKRYAGMSMHNHFIAKQIDALKPGGIGTFVVSRFFLDGKRVDTREYIHNRAAFLGAVRLPGETFSGMASGTKVVTDVVFFRKRLDGEVVPKRGEVGAEWLDVMPWQAKDAHGNAFGPVATVNRWIDQHLAQAVLGRMRVGEHGIYGGSALEVDGRGLDGKPRGVEALRGEIAQVAGALLEQSGKKFDPQTRRGNGATDGLNAAARSEMDGKSIGGFEHPAVMTGSYFNGSDGKLYAKRLNSVGEAVAVAVREDFTNDDLKQEKASFSGKGAFKRWYHVKDAHLRLTAQEGRIVRAINELRNVRYDLAALEQQDGVTDELLKEKRAALNSAYQVFLKAAEGYGNNRPRGSKTTYLSDSAIAQLMEKDPAFSQVLGLELPQKSAAVNEEAGEDGKRSERAGTITGMTLSPIFERRVSKPKAELKTHYDDANEAMLASLGMRGRIDLAWMEEVTGKSEEEVLEAIGERAFVNPVSGELEIGAHYLSGDVKTKLEEARRADGGSGRFERNIKALEKVIPEDIPAEELLVGLNSPYVPPMQVERFFSNALGVSNLRVNYAQENSKWIVSVGGYTDNLNTELDKMLSGIPIRKDKFLQAVMDGVPPKIYKTVNGKLALDEAATDNAREQYERVHEMWEGWWKSDAKAVREIPAIYNERVNRYADPVYDGSFLRFDGLNSVYTLNKHQRDAVARTVMTGKVLLNHVVGSGKTLSTICAIMEMRKMGLVNKPIVSVPNQITEQWRQDFLKAYPAANVLCATEDEMKDSNRRKALYSRIQNGDYDAVILPHSMLSRLPLSPQMEAYYLEKQIADFRAALAEMSKNRADKRTIKNMEKRIEKYEEKLNRLRDKPKDETGLYFDTLGFDGFFLDEAHIFKNVPFVCSQQVAGMGNPEGSKQAFDLLMKMDYLREFKAGSPTVFMTGTPISNSLTEIFTNMRLMAPDLLEKSGIKTMDAFLRQFCEMTEEAEFDATGQMRLRNRLRRVVNAGDLMVMVRSYMDVVQQDDLARSMEAVGKRYNVPKVEGDGPQTVAAKRSPEQEEYFGKPAKIGQEREEYGVIGGVRVMNIISRAEAVRKRRVKPHEDNMLKITSNAKAASLDMRLLFPNAPDFAGSKVNLCVGEVMKVYRDYADVKGTQIIWCDLSTPKSSMGDVKKQIAERKAFLDKVQEAIAKAEANGNSAFEVEALGETDGDGNAVGTGESLGDQANRVKGQIAELEAKVTSGFSVYDDIKEKLVAHGVKPSEVAFVHDYDTKAKKALLNERMNRGDIRVLIGSTSKMGTGMNVQERLVAMHHLDCPWKPAELEQRNGRIIRQGNKLYDADPEHFRVQIKNYVTEATNDAAMYQTILNKQISLNSLYKADRWTRSVEDVWTPQARSAEEMMAEASGSKLLPLRAQMGKQTNELRRKRDSFDAKRVRLESGIDENETELIALERTFEQQQRVHEMAQEKPDNSKNKYAGFELLFREEAPKTFDFKTFKERVQQAQPMIDLLRGMREDGRVRYRGLTAKIAFRSNGELFDANNSVDRYKLDYRFEFLDKNGRAIGYSTWTQYPANDSSIDESFFGKLNRAIDGFIGEKWEETKSKREKQIDDKRKTIALQKGELEKMPKENPYAADYERLSKEFDDLMAVTNANAVNSVEAHEMLRKKYEEAGMRVPEYSWASPSEEEVAQYNREIEAANAKKSAAPGMLREPAYERIVRERLKMRGIDESQLPPDERAVLDAYRAHQEALPKGVVGKAKDGLKQFNERLPGETTEAWRKRKLQEAKDWIETVAVDATTPLRRAVEQITGGKKLKDDEDIAKAMQLSYGKVAERHREIEQKYTRKIMHILAKNGLDVPMLDVYLTAKFAPERNAMILERAEWKDAGSGMTDEMAEAQLRGLKDSIGDAKFAELERAAEVVYQMNRDNLDGMADSGVLSREQVEEWKRLSPHYVPLREDMSRLGMDDVQGTSLAGTPYKRAVGRFTEMTSSTLGWSILQTMQGVILQEQNYVNNVALNFCKQHASAEDYRISVLPKRVERAFKAKGTLGFSMARAVPLLQSRASDRQIIDAMRQQGYTVVPEGNGSDVVWVDARELDQKMAVRKMPDYSTTRNKQTVVARVNGRRVYILFNAKVGSRGNKMGMAITKANVHHWDNPIWNAIVGATRIKAAMSTVFAPTFAVRNAVADLVNTITIMSTEMKGKELGMVLKNYGGALNEYAKFRKSGQFNDNTLLGRYLKEAMREGLLTGIYANSTYEKNMAENVLKPFKEMQHKIGMEQNAFSLDTLAYGWDKLKNGVQVFSEIPEVGIRLAVYSAMRESGMSISDATVYAREITVDFNKKGTITPITNVLYMFSNAGVQALSRYLKATKTGGTKGALLGAMLFTSIGFFGRLWNRMLVDALFGGGDDDDEEAWKNIPEYISDRGLPIVLHGGQYLEVPTRGIQSAFMLMGQKLYDMAIAKDEEPLSAVYDILRGPLAENINFVGNSGSFWQAVAPTALDPVVQLIENKSWTGQRLHSIDYGNSAAPKYGYARKQTSPAYVWLSKFFSDMSGGDEVEGGAVNVYPEELALIGQFFTSTVGVDIEKLGSFVSGDFSTRNVPILRGFVRPIPDNTNRYFNAKLDFNKKLKNYKAYLNIDIARARTYYDENQLLSNADRLNNLQREIERLSKVKARLASEGVENESLNRTINAIRMRFLEIYEAGKMSK